MKTAIVAKELFVMGLGITGDSKRTVLILSDEMNQRAIPIWIAESDAVNLSIAIMGSESKRPLTHETMLNIIKGLGCRLEHVEISEAKDEIFFASIVISRDGALKESGREFIEIDARPSDAVALAVWSGKPLYVNPDVFDKESVSLSVSSEGFLLSEAERNLVEEDDQEFRDFLNKVNASDFTLPE